MALSEPNSRGRGTVEFGGEEACNVEEKEDEPGQVGRFEAISAEESHTRSSGSSSAHAPFAGTVSPGGETSVLRSLFLSR